MSLLGGIFNQFLGQLGKGDEIRDYQHAARTFIDSQYRLSPKIGSMFHVFVDVNQNIASLDQGNQIEIGMMAKSVTLPKFTFQTKTLNSYNRKTINQERVNYDPVTITFHDDSADVVRDFWYGYFSYYYRDSDHQLPLYNLETKYDLRKEQKWGFTPKVGSTAEPYINAIYIYSLHQKSFSSYILIKPTITSFQHGQHTAGEYAPIEHTMSLAYEAVQYETGPVSEGSVQGFSSIHYDKTPSPLSSIGGGTTSILGPGGLVDSIGGVTTNLQNGNLLGAALTGFRTFNNFKNADLKQVATAELAQTAVNVLKGQNTQSTVFVPTMSSIKEGLSKAVNKTPGEYTKTGSGLDTINNPFNTR